MEKRFEVTLINKKDKSDTNKKYIIGDYSKKKAGKLVVDAYNKEFNVTFAVYNVEVVEG